MDPPPSKTADFLADADPNMVAPLQMDNSASAASKPSFYRYLSEAKKRLAKSPRNPDQVIYEKKGLPLDPLVPTRRRSRRKLYKTSIEKWRPGKSKITCPKCGATRTPTVRAQSQRVTIIVSNSDLFLITSSMRRSRAIPWELPASWHCGHSALCLVSSRHRRKSSCTAQSASSVLVSTIGKPVVQLPRTSRCTLKWNHRPKKSSILNRRWARRMWMASTWHIENRFKKVEMSLTTKKLDWINYLDYIVQNYSNIIIGV